MKEVSSIYISESSKNGRNKTETATANPYQELNVYTSKVKSAVTNTSRPTIFWEYYSSWNKTKRHVAWIVKLKANWLNWKRKEKKLGNFSFVTCGELLKSEMSQEESYLSELKSLLLNDDVHKYSSLVPLNPTLNNQSLLCMGGRVKNTDIFANSKNQLIVNKDHPIAKLIVKHYHEENLHVGREQTLSSPGSKYWIPSCRRIIRLVIPSWLYCKSERIKPAPPFMSDIPEDRLCIDEKPFANTGVDYLCPYHIKLSKRTRSNQVTSKRYVAAFTCLTTGTVHLKIAGDFSTDAFILALRRCISRRGKVNTIRSDNGTILSVPQKS